MKPKIGLIRSIRRCFSTPAACKLSKDQIEHFHELGYVKIPNVMSTAEMEEFDKVSSFAILLFLQSCTIIVADVSDLLSVPAKGHCCSQA
jgi:hypothetical protein